MKLFYWLQLLVVVLHPKKINPVVLKQKKVFLVVLNQMKKNSANRAMAIAKVNLVNA